MAGVESAVSQDTRGYRETGGVRWGALPVVVSYATFPFGRLYVDEERIVIDVDAVWVKRTFCFPKSDVQSIGKKRGIFSKGILIQRSGMAYPSVVIFWMFSFARLKANLERFGYPVT